MSFVHSVVFFFKVQYKLDSVFWKSVIQTRKNNISPEKGLPSLFKGCPNRRLYPWKIKAFNTKKNKGGEKTFTTLSI